MPEFDLALQDILGPLHEKRYQDLRNYLDTLNPADITEMLQALYDDELVSNEELVKVFRLIPKDLSSDAFVEMDPEMQQALISAFSDKELHEVIDDMYLDDTVDIIEEMPANVVTRILKNVDADTRRNINLILRYPEDSAGSIMTIEYVELHPDMTVQDAFAEIRRTGVDKETIYTCYVTEKKKLVGIVTVRELLLSAYEDLVQDIMEENVISVNTLDDKEEVAQMFAKYDFTALPVVDKENRLVGIVTVDDAIEVINDEATEDIEKMAAITPSEHPYLKAGVIETWKQRIPWLLLLMISATFTGMIITSFEDALAAHVVLTAFIPMIMDTGGNSGSQASVTIIRGLSLGEIELSDVGEVVWKEIRVALMCGISLGLVSMLKLMIVDRMMLGNSSINFTVAAVVSLTLAFTVLISKIVGCLLPMGAKKIGFDPAVMASPFITTIVDALSLMIYMNLATLLLGIVV